MARYIAGRRSGSAAAKVIHDEKAAGFGRLTGGMNYIDLPRMAYYVDKATYRREVTQRIRALKGAA